MKLPIILSLILIATNAMAQNLVKEGAKIESIGDAFRFTEGPIADANGDVYFSDIPNKTIWKWSPITGLNPFMKEVMGCNGIFFDNDSNLVVGGNGEGQNVWKVNIQTKETTVLASTYKGNKLNGPNDLWIDKKGGIYFTDPLYGKRDPNIPIQELERVFYLQPDGKLTPVIEDYKRPNGIIATPNGKTLYVADINDTKVYSYKVNKDGSLSNKKLFANERCDGMTMDEKGNLYFTSKGVVVYSKKGAKLTSIEIPEGCTNVCFAGKERKTLFVTAKNKCYTLEMNVKGVY